MFTSGNGVITGAKTEDEIVKAFDATYHLIKPWFREKSNPHCDKGKRYKNAEWLEKVKSDLDETRGNVDVDVDIGN